MTPPPDIIAAAQAAEATWRVPASVSIAQWALESGWGAHAPGFNCFGIKALPGYSIQSFATHECRNGHIVPCTQTFAKFDSIAQAFDCHAKLLATSAYYKTAFDALPDTGRFIDLMAVHYASDPQYAAKVKAVIAGADLAQYNTEAAHG